MKFEAWPVDPPGFGSVPLSSRTMSRQPLRARGQAMLFPTIPAPMTTTLAPSRSPARATPPPCGPAGSPRASRRSGEVDDDRLELGHPVHREAATDAADAAL